MFATKITEMCCVPRAFNRLFASTIYIINTLLNFILLDAMVQIDKIMIQSYVQKT